MTDVGHLAEIADGFLDVVDAVGNEVTKEKVKAIGARNRLQTIGNFASRDRKFGPRIHFFLN